MAARRNYSNYAEVRHDVDTYAWSQDKGLWKLCHRNSVAADVVLETTKTRREDMTGLKAFRVVTEHDVSVTLRTTYGDYTLNSLHFYGGEVAALKSLLGMFASGHLFRLAKLDAEDTARKRGASHLQRLEADDVYDWQYDSRTDFENERERLAQFVQLLGRL